MVKKHKKNVKVDISGFDETEQMAAILKDVNTYYSTTAKEFKLLCIMTISYIKEWIRKADEKTCKRVDFFIEGLNIITFSLNIFVVKNPKNLNNGKKKSKKRNDIKFLLKIHNPFLINGVVLINFKLVTKRNNDVVIIKKKVLLNTLLIERELYTIDGYNFEYSIKSCRCHIKVGTLTREVISRSISSDIQSPLKRLFETSFSSDCTISVQDMKFKVHKSILGLRSPIFKAMFKKATCENEHEIQFENPKAFHEMLKYIYYEEVSNLEEFFYDLILLADRYYLLTLKSICIEFFKSNISLLNISETIMLIKNKNLIILKEPLITFLKTNKEEFINSNAFEMIATSHIDILREFCLKL